MSLPEKREIYLHISENSCNFALAKDTSMTDTEYIQAFRARNNKAITLFYRQYRDSFMAFLANKFHSLNQQLLAEVFQESVSRVWENIERGKLTETSLTSSLSTYLNSTGIRVWLETNRRYGEDIPNDEDIFVKAQEAYEMERADADEKMQFRQDRQDATREVVDKMGKPCAPLLMAFYWDNNSWDNIARELHYSNAESAKTQKYKCMQRLKTLLKGL